MTELNCIPALYIFLSRGVKSAQEEGGTGMGTPKATLSPPLKYGKK